jgi:hypothetical protein
MTQQQQQQQQQQLKQEDDSRGSNAHDLTLASARPRGPV